MHKQRWTTGGSKRCVQVANILAMQTHTQAQTPCHRPGVRPLRPRRASDCLGFQKYVAPLPPAARPRHVPQESSPGEVAHYQSARSGQHSLFPFFHVCPVDCPQVLASRGLAPPQSHRHIPMRRVIASASTMPSAATALPAGALRRWQIASYQQTDAGREKDQL